MERVKWWDKIFNFFEDFEPRLKVSVRWAEMVAFLVLSRLIVNSNSTILDLGFNPLGIFSHLGNLVAVPYALLGTFIVCITVTRFFVSEIRLARIVLALSGLLSGLVVNIVAESGAGMHAIGLPNTGDPLDVLWGTLFCVLACLVSFRVVRKVKANE